MHELEMSAIQRVFKNNGLQSPLKLTQLVEQGNCSTSTTSIENIKDDSWLSNQWQKSKAFKACLAMTNRFNAYINGSNLVDLDGAKFPKQ